MTTPHAPAIPSPFERLAALLGGIAPGRPPIDLTVGEPRAGAPDFVGPMLAESAADFGRYPPIRGTDAFRQAVADWLGRRYGLAEPIDPVRGVIPLNGSREGLFSAAFAARRRLPGRADPVVLLPNPFYPVYAAGAVAAGAEPIALPAGRATGFLPDLDAVPPALLDRTVALYLASPSNPEGAVASLAFWRRAVELARRHGFMVLADECYSEIYRGDPPPGVLQAAADLGAGYGSVVTFNSLSKRSSLPGLRCGFAAGDPDFIAAWATFRNVTAPQVPLPVQAVAARALADETHVAANRRRYDAAFATAERLLAGRFGHRTPPGGFFLWLDMSAVGGGEAAALALWQEVGVRAVPGGYLATGAAGDNPGADFLRLAMVDTADRTEDALRRLVGLFAPDLTPDPSGTQHA